MKNITLKSLTITNFKGLKSFSLENLSNYVSIYGVNASGKTTIFDAFCFLLWGKDSADRKDFGIKPLDKSGNPSERIESDVKAILEVDGVEISLRHVFKENWVKKRGEAEATFVGNEHLYFWNDVPLKASEYQAKIDTIIPENVFKLLTNPLYFNSLKWQDRRAVLQQMVGEVSDEEVLASLPELSSLIAQLTGKTIQEIRAQISSEKKKIKETLESINPRIDELNRQKPSLEGIEEVEAKVKQLQADYTAVEKQIDDRNEAHKAHLEELGKVNREIFERESENQKIRFGHQKQYESDHLAATEKPRELQRRIEMLQADYRSVQNALDSLSNSLQTTKSSYDYKLKISKQEVEEAQGKYHQLRDEYAAAKAKEIDPNQLTCAECGRPHEAHNLATLQENFNKRKQTELEIIKQKGHAQSEHVNVLIKRGAALADEYKAAIERVAQDIEAQSTKKEEIEKEINSLKAMIDVVIASPIEVESVESRLEKDAQYQNNIVKIQELKEQAAQAHQIDISDLREQRDAISDQLQEAKLKLADKVRVKEIESRVEELLQIEKQSAQRLADLEKQEFMAQQYEKFKSTELERKVNGMFKYAKFKLFNQLINGGEEPTCVTTFEGVPFPDLNNAAKIQIGLDIINTLSAFHGVTAPVFLDNRESVTTIPETNAQVINLIVSPDDAQLRVVA